jgi:hypothetical protein
MNSSNALKSKITRDSLGSFDIKDQEIMPSLRNLISFNEQIPLSRHSTNEIGSKYLNNMNVTNGPTAYNQTVNPSIHQYLHNHNHIHIHNHSHVHKLNLKNNESDYLCHTTEIKEECLVDEKLKVLMNIFNSEIKDKDQEKKSQNIQKNNEDNEKNKKRGNDKKCFSLLTLLNISTQINSLLLIDNEFDVCRSYMNCFINNINNNKL